MRVIFLLTAIVILLAPAMANISPEIKEKLDERDDDEVIEVLVPFDTEINDSEGLTESNFSTSGAEIKEEYEKFDTFLMNVTISEVEKISDKEFIDRIEPDYEIKALLDQSSIQIGSRISHETGVTGKNVSIAVMDSGISEHDNLELKGQRDFTGEGIGDENGHGTHVAGIIGSTHREYRGVSYESDIYDVKVLNSEGKGRGSNMLRGLDYVIRNDMDVAVMSLGTTVDECGGKDVLSRAVREAVRRGTTITASAGNSGPQNNTLTAPGCSERVVTVGSIDKSDSMATYSSRGPTSDGRVKPDIVAPGSSIISTGKNNDFVSMSGTSMAAPQAAGQAALILSESPDKDPAEVKKTIINSADDLGYPENAQGAGRINVPHSLNATAEVQHIEERSSFLNRVWAWFTGLF